MKQWYVFQNISATIAQYKFVYSQQHENWSVTVAISSHFTTVVYSIVKLIGIPDIPKQEIYNRKYTICWAAL